MYDPKNEVWRNGFQLGINLSVSDVASEKGVFTDTLIGYAETNDKSIDIATEKATSFSNSIILDMLMQAYSGSFLTDVTPYEEIDSEDSTILNYGVKIVYKTEVFYVFAQLKDHVIDTTTGITMYCYNDKCPTKYQCGVFTRVERTQDEGKFYYVTGTVLSNFNEKIVKTVCSFFCLTDDILYISGIGWFKVGVGQLTSNLKIDNTAYSSIQNIFVGIFPNYLSKESIGFTKVDPIEFTSADGKVFYMPQVGIKILCYPSTISAKITLLDNSNTYFYVTIIDNHFWINNYGNLLN